MVKEMGRIGMVALILGLCGVLLGGAVFMVSLLLPVITNGRTSWDEAMFGVIPGALLLCFSFVLAVAGGVVMILERKKRLQGAA